MTLESFLDKFEFITYTDNGMAVSSEIIRIYIPLDSDVSWFDFGCLDTSSGSKRELIHEIFPPDILSREIDYISYNEFIPGRIDIMLKGKKV